MHQSIHPEIGWNHVQSDLSCSMTGSGAGITHSSAWCGLQGIIEGKDGELEALRERLAEAKAVATGRDEELTAAQQQAADRRAPAGPTCISPVSAGCMSSHWLYVITLALLAGWKPCVRRKRD